MRVLILGDINSVHIRKWCTSLAEVGISIGIFSLTEVGVKWFEENDNIDVLGHGAIKDAATFRKKVFSKIKYLKVVPALKKAIKSFQPDILHAHYATSYGLLGVLTGFHPYYISVWGNDVFDFPNENAVQKLMLKSNLKNADRIFSTSHIMAKETGKYTEKQIDVIPFGVDLLNFRSKSEVVDRESDSILIGTIKTLEKDYAIDVLIKAFSIVYKGSSALDLNLMICGDGSLKAELIQLVAELEIDHVTTFTGFIQHEEVPGYLDKMDIFCCFSDEESFGVAVVEAMAMGKPVVVSDAAGLPEVVENGLSGAIVPRQNPEQAAEAIEKLVNDQALRKSMGDKAKVRAQSEYNWKDSVSKMGDAYGEA